MKKNLLLLVTAACFTLSGYAQIQSNRSDANNGFTGKQDIGGSVYRCVINFNFGTGTNVGLNGFNQKLTRDNNFKGIYAQSVNDLGTKDCYNVKWGNGTNAAPNNMYHFSSIAAYLDSVYTSGKPWETSQKWFKPQAFITDIAEGDQALTYYPGIYHNQWYALQIKRTNYMISDISFNLATIDKGTSGATSAYKLVVMLDKDFIGLNSPSKKALLDTLTASNAALVGSQLGATDSTFFVADNIYTPEATLNTKKNILLGASGVSLDQLNKATNIYVLVYCNNKTVSISNVYDPVIAMDDIQYDYADAGWTLPAGVTDGTRVSDSIQVAANVLAYDTIYATGYGRSNALTVYAKHNESGTYSSLIDQVHLLETAGIKAYNAATGAYDTDITYNYAKDENNNETLTIAKPASGVANDTLAIIVAYNPTQADKTYYQDIEVSNGVRFIYYLKLHSNLVTGVTAAKTAASIVTGNNNIKVINNESNVIISDLGGSIVANVSASKAAKGISVNSGTYIVKLDGGTTKKVLVK
jgi:hypothetical protein